MKCMYITQYLHIVHYRRQYSKAEKKNRVKSAKKAMEDLLRNEDLLLGNI